MLSNDTWRKVHCCGWASATLVCGLLALSCNQGDDASALDADASTAFGDQACRAPNGVSNAPHTIAQARELLNALPKPITVACFVEALAHPLALQAVDSIFSAQPAEGSRSPRVFIFYEGLILSVALDGPGAQLLEFGEARPNDQSLKAELEFPIDTKLNEADPYKRLPFDDTITTCGFCHVGEKLDPTINSENAFISPALRSTPDQRIPLSTLQNEFRTCDPTTEPTRCALLNALFQGGDPVEHEFPATYATFLVE